MGRKRQNRSPRRLTTKGLRTRQALLDAARDAFEDKGYFAASVSEIGRRCGVSQGVFYQYFSNKEQVFRELVDSLLDHFWRRTLVRPDGADTFESNLRDVVALLLDHCQENAAFHRVLNEFELIDIISIGYYDSLARYYRNFFREAINAGLIKPLDPNVVAYSLIGIATFHQMDWGEDSRVFNRDELVVLTADFVINGLSGPAPYEPPAELAVSAFPPSGDGEFQWDEAQTPGQRTRRDIFRAAEQIFGRLGYNRASVAEITRLAGVAQGTFYIHFESKDDLMLGVVRFLSREMRRELRRITDLTADRREQEREGMIGFFRFLKNHRQIYRVVAESETIGREVALWYYRKLAAGYRDAIAEAVSNSEVRSLPVDFLVHSMMGLNHMLGLKWLVWNSSPEAEIPEQVAEDAIELALFGLAPE